MTIGATEDIAKQPDLVAAKAQMDLLKLAGLKGVRITQEWAPGQTEPGGGDFDALKNAVASECNSSLDWFQSMVLNCDKTANKVVNAFLLQGRYRDDTTSWQSYCAGRSAYSISPDRIAGYNGNNGGGMWQGAPLQTPHFSGSYVFSCWDDGNQC